jgi:hypothetical protein
MKKRALITLVALSGSPALGAEPAPSGRVSVQPVFFIPADVLASPSDLVVASAQLELHLRLARSFYRSLVKTDSFAVSGPPLQFKSKNVLAYFDVRPSAQPDSAHRMTTELLAWRGENWVSSRTVFVAIIVRGGRPPCPPDADGYAGCGVGGGRTFNGLPGTGGGIDQLELGSIHPSCTNWVTPSG